MRVILKNIFIFLTAASGLLVFLYLLLYLALPFIANKHDYSNIISEKVKKETGLELVLYNCKLKMSPSLALTIKADDIELFYPDKQQILDIEKAKINLSLLHLLKKEIKITALKADKFQFSGKLKTSGKLTLQEYIDKHFTASSDLKYSVKIPSVNIKSYLIKIKDEKTGLHYRITGNDYHMVQDITRKNILVTAAGEIYIRGKKNIDYKLKLCIPADIFSHQEKSSLDLSNLSKYTFKSKIDADVRIFSKDGKYDYSSGKIKISGFSILLNGLYTPPGYANIALDKSLANIDAKMFTAKNESADIKAKVRLTKPENIEIHCKTSRINIENLKTIILPVLDLMKIKNNLEEFNAGGYISADFNLKTDLKKVKSNGKLIIKNGGLKHKKIPLDINGVNAEVDFSNDSIKIVKSDIFVNNQPVKLTGTIDKNAIGDIKITAKNLDINHIMNAFPIIKPDENIIVTSGKMSFDAFLKGKLTKISPVIHASISNLSSEFKDIYFSSDIISLNADVQNNIYKGNAKIKKAHLKKAEAPVSVSSDLILINFNEKDLEIVDSKILAGKTPVRIAGNIKNYKKSPRIDINAAGTIDTALLTSFIKNNKDIEAKGALPTVLNIKSRDKTAKITMHALANENNYIKPAGISLADKSTTLTRLNTNIDKELITIKELAMFSADGITKASFDVDTSSMKKIISINGCLSKTDLRNIKISIPQKTALKLSTTGNLRADGNINLNGNIEKPDISGTLNLYDLNIPDYKISLANAAVTFTKDGLKTAINGIKIKNMTINTVITAAPDFLKTKKISNVKINSNLLDMDELLSISDILPQTTYAPGPECPFDIQTGEITLNTYKMGKVFGTNVHSNFSLQNNILNLYDLTADAYSGKIAAKISYNLPYATIDAKVQGRNLNAESAGRSLFPVDPKTTGIMSFDSDVRTYGFSAEQQKKNLTGTTDILIKNATLGPLGRFEHFLYAQNLLSQRLIYVSLNSAKQAITPQDTGRVNYVKTSVKFKNGFMYINPVLTSGPQMSMYVTGHINMMNNIANLEILGKISPEVSSSLGLFGQMTIKDFLDEHTKYGTAAAKLFSFYNKELPQVDISKIPPLTPSLNRETRNFRVIIDGNMDSVKAVKSFTWVNPIGTSDLKKETGTVNSLQEKAPEKIQTQASQTIQNKIEEPKTTVPQNPVSQKQTSVPGFLDSIPDEFTETKPKISQ